MSAGGPQTAAERRAATCPVRMGGRNRLKRDAPSAMKLKESMQSQFSPINKIEPHRLHINAIKTLMMAQPRDIDDCDEISSIVLVEAVGGHWSSMSSDALGASNHGSWPRVRKQRTPKGAMNIWEVNEALAEPARPDSSKSTPKELQDDACFVNAIFGADASKSNGDKPKLSHQDVLGSLGTDLSHMHLPEGSSTHGNIADIVSQNSFQDIVYEAPSMDLSAGEMMYLSQSEELTEFVARTRGPSQSSLTNRDRLLSMVESDVVEQSWDIQSGPANDRQLQVQMPLGPQSSSIEFDGMLNMASPAQMTLCQPGMLVATVMPIPMRSIPPSVYTVPASGNTPMSEGFSLSSAKPLQPPKSKRNGPERKEWSAAEDAIIREGVTNFGCRWRRIAAELIGRSDDAVRNRWNRLNDTFVDNPSAPVQKSHQPAALLGKKQSAVKSNHTNNYMSQKCAMSVRATGIRDRPERVSWTRTEDAIIVRSVAELGHKWYQIASRLPGRTDHAIRNRFHRLQAMADDMQIINERNGINTLQEHPAAMAHRVHMPPMNVMQSIQLFPSMRAKVHDSTSPLEQQRQQLQEQQRELQRRQLVLEQQERELLQQHRQQQNMYQQQVIQGQMPRDQTSSQDQIVPQTAPLRLCV